jgi:hypothetical protein
VIVGHPGTRTMSAPDIGAALERAYAPMDKSTGMYPADWTCKACGKVLNADGGHPAELYAGTYTGLCYGCERAGTYVVPDSELPDGARRISWPPACPSWRRDRTEHWAYPDCEDCKGKGARMRYGRNGQWTEYCRPCMTRVMAPREVNEVKLLRTVAGALEIASGALSPAAEVMECETPAWASLRALVARVAPMALRMYAREPAAWRPGAHVLESAVSQRLTPAQRRAKRADTLLRHVVAALHAEADERTSK